MMRGSIDEITAHIHTTSDQIIIEPCATSSAVNEDQRRKNIDDYNASIREYFGSIFLYYMSIVYQLTLLEKECENAFLDGYKKELKIAIESSEMKYFILGSVASFQIGGLTLIEDSEKNTLKVVGSTTALIQQLNLLIRHQKIQISPASYIAMYQAKKKKSALNEIGLNEKNLLDENVYIYDYQNRCIRFDRETIKENYLDRSKRISRLSSRVLSSIGIVPEKKNELDEATGKIIETIHSVIGIQTEKLSARKTRLTNQLEGLSEKEKRLREYGENDLNLSLIVVCLKIKNIKAELELIESKITGLNCLIETLKDKQYDFEQAQTLVFGKYNPEQIFGHRRYADWLPNELRPKSNTKKTFEQVDCLLNRYKKETGQNCCSFFLNNNCNLFEAPHSAINAFTIF